MKNLISKFAIIFSILLLLLSFSACNDDQDILTSDGIEQSDQEVLEKLVDEDESLQSFDINYNEDDAMGYVLGKTATEIYPLKMGQRMVLTSRTLDIVMDDDTSATGILTKSFDGILYIIASTDSLKNIFDTNNVDLYQKLFSTTITRVIKFKKVENSINPERNWKISAISLPEGGTLTENIEITKVTVYLPDGETVEIESPSEYFMSRENGPFHNLLRFENLDRVKVRVDIKSVYEEVDFVSLTYGAVRGHLNNRAKRRFELISQDFDGAYYIRTYENEWTIGLNEGFRHAIINALPYGVIKDSEAPVESNSWGIPYFVQ